MAAADCQIWDRELARLKNGSPLKRWKLLPELGGSEA